MAFAAYAQESVDWLPGGDWSDGKYMNANMAPYLGGGAATANPWPRALTGTFVWPDLAPFKTLGPCPSRPDHRGGTSIITTWSEGMIQCDYAFFTGHGNRSYNCSYGNRRETGWCDSYFSNDHFPSLSYRHDWVVGKEDQRVIMVDDTNWVITGGKQVPYVSGTVVYLNHGLGDLFATGQNMLYLDGHVVWKVDPWRTGVQRWSGARGRLSW